MQNQKQYTCKWTMVTNNKPMFDTWFWWSKINTQKHQLPNRSPELAVTKTQLSLGRKRRRIWRFRVMFTVDLSSLYASLSRTDQHRQLGCQIIISHTFLGEAHRSLCISYKHNYFRTLSHSLSVNSQICPPYLFLSLSKSLSLTHNFLIRNYANDPKTERKGVRQCGFYSTCTVLSLSQNKIQPTEKSSSKGCQPSSSPLSSSSTPSWERRQRGRRERGIRVRIRGLLHCRQHGKKMHLDRNLQIKSNDRNILRNVHIFSGFKYS